MGELRSPREMTPFLNGPLAAGVCLWFQLSFCDTFTCVDDTLVLTLVNCTLMLQWLIRAIFGLMNLLEALLQTVWHF